jgi:branched-chain amino acid aminotransferase
VIVLDQDQSAESAQHFDLRDRGLLLADGVFDTSMVIGGRIVFRGAHAARLRRDADAFGIAVEPARIDAAIAKATEGAGFGALRVTVTRGPGPRALAPVGVGRATILAAFMPGDPKRVFAPVRVAPTAIRRNETSPSSRHKTLAYLDAVMAAREAAAAGADEALFLNTQGRLACAAAGNVFILSGDALKTPAVAEGAMPGTVRGWILANAARAGLSAAEAEIAPEEVRAADAAFVTGSLRLIAPATGIAAAGSATPPPAVTKLMTLLVEDLTAAGFAPPFAAPSGG